MCCPEEVDGYFRGLREIQQQYLPVVTQEFAPVPVRTVPFFDREMVGMERLSDIGRALFGDDDPTQVLYSGRPYQVRRQDGAYVLTLELPFASRDEVKLSRNGSDLVVQVGGWRRTLVLPRALIGATTLGARMENHRLRIEFEAPRRARQGGDRR